MKLLSRMMLGSGVVVAVCLMFAPTVPAHAGSCAYGDACQINSGGLILGGFCVYDDGDPNYNCGCLAGGVLVHDGGNCLE